MNIGFDAKRAFLNDTGLGEYSRNLLRSLFAQFPEHRYTLYTPCARARADLSFLAGHAHVRTATPARRPARLAPGLWRSFGLAGEIRRDGIDLYHGLSHELPIGVRSVRVKTVVTMHDLIFLRYPAQYSPIDRSIYRWKWRHACDTADAVIAVSAQTKSDLVEFLHVDPQKIHVIYQSAHPIFSMAAPEETKAAVRARHQLPASFLLSVGSLIERKNVLTLIRALGMLKTPLDPCLVVVGSGGAYERRVRRAVEEGGLSERVFFLRGVPRGEVAALYQMADAFVYPSLFEGFGIPVIEALLSGVPVITSRVSSLPEAGGPAAAYVDPENAEDLAQSIARVLEDPAERRRMISAGRDHAQRFAPATLSAQLMGLYRSLT